MGEMEAKEQARKKLAAWGSPISVPVSPRVFRFSSSSRGFVLTPRRHPLQPSPPVSPPASAVCEEETNSLPDVTTRTCTDWRAACQKNQPIPVVDPSKSMRCVFAFHCLARDNATDSSRPLQQAKPSSVQLLLPLWIVLRSPLQGELGGWRHKPSERRADFRPLPPSSRTCISLPRPKSRR